MSVVANRVTIPEAKNYVRGEINHLIHPGLYEGIIIEGYAMGDGTYCWVLGLLGDVSEKKYAIEVIVNPDQFKYHLKSDEQIGKQVQVGLGEYYADDTHARLVLSVAFAGEGAEDKYSHTIEFLNDHTKSLLQHMSGSVTEVVGMIREMPENHRPRLTATAGEFEALFELIQSMHAKF